MQDEYEPSVDDYINRLRYDPDPEVRRNAVWVLGRYRDQEVIDPLIQTLDDDDATVRLQVVEVMRNFKDNRVMPPLIKSLTDSIAEVRAQAAASLGHIGDKQAVEPLLEIATDGDPQVRSHVMEALGLLKQAKATETLVNALVEDQDANVRFYAAQSLSTMGGQEIVQRLCALLSENADTGLLIEVIEVLAKISDLSAINTLLPLENHADEGVSATAKWAINVLQKANK